MGVKRLVDQGDQIFLVVFGGPVRYIGGNFLVKNFLVSIKVFESPRTDSPPVEDPALGLGCGKALA